MNLEILFPLYCEILVKSTAVLAAVALLVALWRGASAAARHLVWASAMAQPSRLETRVRAILDARRVSRGSDRRRNGGRAERCPPRGWRWSSASGAGWPLARLPRPES